MSVDGDGTAAGEGSTATGMPSAGVSALRGCWAGNGGRGRRPAAGSVGSPRKRAVARREAGDRVLGEEGAAHGQDAPWAGPSARAAGPAARVGSARRRRDLAGRRRRVGVRRARRRGCRLQASLQPLHHDVGARVAVLVDRVLVPLQPLVDRAEVEVDLRVALRQLERLQERRLGVLEPVELEADEAEVVVQRVRVGALRDELAVDLLGLVELLGAEVDEAEDVEDARVARPQEVGLLELALRVVVALRLEELAPLVEVREEEALVERSPRDRRRALGQNAQSSARTIWNTVPSSGGASATCVTPALVAPAVVRRRPGRRRAAWAKRRRGRGPAPKPWRSSDDGV